MINRPDLNKILDSVTFQNHYYLKEELVRFCRQEGLQSTGNKSELTMRVSHYLDTGEKLIRKTPIKTPSNIEKITEDTIIESNFICSEKHRIFFKWAIGKTFSFNVNFQNWLKTNSGKNYKDAIQEYHQIMADKKKNETIIGKQFEYNTYVRDFFADNDGKSLDDAIRCWKYKKSMSGHNKYDKSDLCVLNDD